MVGAGENEKQGNDKKIVVFRAKAINLMMQIDLNFFSNFSLVLSSVAGKLELARQRSQN